MAHTSQRTFRGQRSRVYIRSSKWCECAHHLRGRTSRCWDHRGRRSGSHSVPWRRRGEWIASSSSLRRGHLLSLLLQTLSIAGVFALVPLQGSISLLSTIIRPSNTHTHYPVFAPSSHPVPVIRPVPTHTAFRGPAKSLTDLPLPRSFALRDEETPRTIFLVREHRTGIEGMRGGAVPGFDNAWLEEKGPWGLKGVHPVRRVHPHTRTSASVQQHNAN